MSKTTILTLLIFSAISVEADRASFDCEMRELLIQYSAQINPNLSSAKLQMIADALNGTPEKTPGCNVTVPTDLLQSRSHLPRFQIFPLSKEIASAASTFYVDYNNGNDSNSGNQASPFKTIQKALDSTRSGGSGGNIILRSGTHYLSNQLDLTNKDSNTAFSAYPGEEVWLSRGEPLTGIQWKVYNQSAANATWTEQDGQNAVYGSPAGTFLNSTQSSWQACQAICQANFKEGGPCTIWTWHDPTCTGYENQCWFRIDGSYQPTPEAGHYSGFYSGSANQNTYTADLSSFHFSSIAGLRDFSVGKGGKRMIRARFPNADPEIHGFGSGLRATSWVAPTGSLQPVLEFRPLVPNRTTYGPQFQYHQLGSGGVCDGNFATLPGARLGFSPPTGYWCGNQSEGGGAFTWRTPTGMTATNTVLGHQPYQNANGAIIQAWHPYHWASRMYEVGLYKYSNGIGSFTFSAGGFQDARGSDDAGEFYIENVLEELDFPSEWFYNSTTSILYFNFNATIGTFPPTDGSIVAIDGDSIGIINITSPMTAPAVGISFNGIGFRDAAYTYLYPHGQASAGDWGLQRHGAVILDGTENVVIQGCVFERLDGNGIIVSGYNRNAKITNNEFVWIGDTAIAEWSKTIGTPVDGPDGGVDGWDARNGDQPRYTEISYNFAHEMGIWEKQSSFLIEAKSSDAFISNNILFNDPRALVNFNDGFGGNRTLIRNVMFNSCRESGDHGPFNVSLCRFSLNLTSYPFIYIYTNFNFFLFKVLGQASFYNL
jgi:hypothetical protein